jgi:hypothetical protein
VSVGAVHTSQPGQRVTQVSTGGSESALPGASTVSISYGFHGYAPKHTCSPRHVGVGHATKRPPMWG